MDMKAKISCHYKKYTGQNVFDPKILTNADLSIVLKRYEK